MIDNGDKVMKGGTEGKWKEFFSAMTRHQGFYAGGLAGFDVSQLTVKFIFVNQIGKPREYEVKYRICVEKNDTELHLQNPHIM